MQSSVDLGPESASGGPATQRASGGPATQGASRGPASSDSRAVGPGSANPQSGAPASSDPPPGEPASGKPPTIVDVAAAAGVSKSTVSNVVRGADDVATATRERVLAAIELLGYTPNAIARQFVTQRTTILGVLTGDLSNPYYAQMA